MLLANVERAHKAEVYEAFSGAAFGVAVFEVPAGGFERGAIVRGGGIV